MELLFAIIVLLSFNSFLFLFKFFQEQKYGEELTQILIQKEMGCDFCLNKKGHIQSKITTEENEEIEINSNYCPHCGRDLEYTITDLYFEEEII